MPHKSISGPAAGVNAPSEIQAVFNAKSRTFKTSSFVFTAEIPAIEFIREISESGKVALNSFSICARRSKISS